MARYQTGDHVRILHPTEDVIIDTRITAVMYDAELDDDEDENESLYRAEYIGTEEQFQDETYDEIADWEITELLAGPTHDRRTEQALQAEQRRGTTVRTTRPGVTGDMHEFRWAVGDFGFFGRTGDVVREEPRQDGRPVEIDDIVGLRPDLPEEVEESTPRPRNTRSLAERLRDIGIDLTGTLETPTEAEPRVRPTIPTPTECLTIVGVTAQDYTPRLDASRLLSFRFRRNDFIREERQPLMIPQLNPVEDVIEFRDEEGNLWFNVIQHQEMRRYGNLRYDTNNIEWIRADDFFTEQARARANRPVGIPSPYGSKYSPKKKLRRKWGEMPIIKEEKHYADKKYIA
jgi:hypothetical protein